jgi:AhpC/TSA family protein
MKRKLSGCAAVLLTFLSVSYAQNKAKPEKEKVEAPAPMKLKVGDPAPNFTLLNFDGKDLTKVSLQDYRGKKNVALAFYVFAFTGG